MKISKRVLIGAFSIVATILTLGTLIWYSAYRSTRDLEMRASQVIAAWAFENQPIPGFEDKYVGLAWMRKADRWYVICEFLPQDVSLSDNPRIERISNEKALEMLDQEPDGSEGSSFLWIYLKSTSRNKVELFMITAYGGGIGGDMYEFTFKLVDGQLNGIGRYAGGP